MLGSGLMALAGASIIEKRVGTRCGVTVQI